MIWFYFIMFCILIFHRGGRGGGVGYNGGGFDGPPPSNGFGPPGGPGFNGPPNNGGFGPPAGGFGGGYRGDLKRSDGPGGYDDRDSKRPRY